MLTRVFYQSRITGSFGPMVVLSLQTRCQKRNRDAGITSFLFHDHKRIFQVIEGPALQVGAAMQRIRDSKLHTQIEERAVMQSTTREFAQWSFGATNCDDPDYRRLALAGQVGNFFNLDVLAAERLLSMVASRKRRAMAADMRAVMSRNFDPDRPPVRLHVVA